MFMDMYFSVIGFLFAYDDVIRIGVGFCVARSGSDGQCKSLQSWDG